MWADWSAGFLSSSWFVTPDIFHPTLLSSPCYLSGGVLPIRVLCNYWREVSLLRYFGESTSKGQRTDEDKIGVSGYMRKIDRTDRMAATRCDWTTSYKDNCLMGQAHKGSYQCHFGLINGPIDYFSPSRHFSATALSKECQKARRRKDSNWGRQCDHI